VTGGTGRCKDADQLRTNGLLVGFAPAIERNYRHVPTPNVPRRPRQCRGTVSYRYILGLEGTACHASGMVVRCHRRSERNVAMKTSLGIATIAVVFSAILSLAPTVATADYSGKTPGRCGVVPCTDQQQVQQTSSPIPSTSYRGVR